MRKLALITVVALLAGCASATRTVTTSFIDADGDGEREVETVQVTMEYKGAVPVSPGHLVDATDQTDEMALGVASQAIDRGVPVSVNTGGTTVSAGAQGYGTGAYSYGTGAYAAGTTVNGSSGYYVAGTGGGSSLPVLGATGFVGGGTTSSGGVFDPATAKCPDDPDAPRSVTSELACNRTRDDWQTQALAPK